VVIEDEPYEPVKQMLALLLRDLVDVLDMSANREYGLPPCDGIRADNRMNCFQLRTYILGSTASFVV
jgi:hypothetical protein